MASGGPGSPGGGGAGRGRGRPRKDLDPELAPEVARWAGHLRSLIGDCFATDADAARALAVTPVTLSYYLSGKKEVPERAFVRHLHTVLARQNNTPPDAEALERTDQLYLAALAVLQPLVFRLHTLTDQRDAALMREQAAREALRKARASLEFAERDIGGLRRELRLARKEQEAFASQAEDLLRQLRRAHEEAAEAVVAEAIRIAEEAAVTQSARDAAGRRTSKIIMMAGAAASAAAAAVAALGPVTLGGDTPWQAWGWTAAAAAALAAAAASAWRYRLLRRLQVYWDWRAHLLLLALSLAMVTGCAYLLAAGLTTHQDYVAHRLRVSADVSNCRQTGRVLLRAGDENGPSQYAPLYDCDYEWTVNGRTYRQSAEGLKELERERTTVFVEPARPGIMVPEVMSPYRGMYVMALFVLLMLVFPGWHLKELQDKVADQVRKRVDRALTEARESVSTTAS
ncbi:hypothetical protein AB0C70_42575 [Streptomyces sp. NPDC048564]|uniref:hypothetical protein n=1 Tax=Streptomyces sp. NPDC048564 TaxID=3155760 RepID=UPI00343D7CA1